MFTWVKNIFTNEEKPTTAANTPSVSKPELFDRESIELAAFIKTYYTENGSDTLAWLVQQVIADLNNPKVAELFAGYYDGLYSKRDIIERYDELVTVNQEVIEAIAKLGESYSPALVHDLYAQDDCYKLFSEQFVAELLDGVAQCKTNMKQIEKLVYEEYFYCIKDNLDIKKKSGLSEADLYKPADKIEADLIMLLQADIRSRRNE